MRLLFRISLFVLLVSYATSGFAVSDTLKAEPIEPNSIVGTFGVPGTFYTFKKNKKCKARMIGPRPLVLRGTWEIQGDTLVCSFTRANSREVRKMENLKSSPAWSTLILSQGRLYLRYEDEMLYLPKTK